MFVDTFIRRPILASVCSLVIILAGAVAIPTMPVAQYPDLAPPQVIVTAIYNGANAQAVESAVTTPLEQALNGVEGMLYLSSSSTNSGVSQITVTFDLTRNSDIAAVDVQNRVSQTLGRLPPEVRALGVNVQKQSNGFVLGAGVYAEKGEYDSLFISNYIDVFVKDALQRVPGVGQVLVFGERRYSMRLVAGSEQAGEPRTDGSRRGRARCKSRTSRSRPAASATHRRFRARPTRSAYGPRAAWWMPAQFDDIILKAGDAGSLVRLKDVGHAELGAESYSSQLRFQGIDAVGFGVFAAAERQRAGRRSSRPRRARTAGEDLSARPEVSGRLQHHAGRRRVDQGSPQDADRGDRAGRPGDVRLPAKLAQHADPNDHHPGLADRRLRVREADGLLDQHADPLRHHPRHRHRRRRCDRGD